MKKVLLVLRLYFLRIWYSKSLNKIANIKYNQVLQYKTVSLKFEKIYQTLSFNYTNRLETKLWKNNNNFLVKLFLPFPPFCFLTNYLVARMMFVTRNKKQIDTELKELENIFNRKSLSKLLLEDYVGCPIIQNQKYLTSRNSIHHLYHLIRYQEIMRIKLDKLINIVEWGGGYGNLCKIYHRLVKTKITYLLIDTPLFSTIQWFYLSIIFGEKRINILTKSNLKIKKGKINICSGNLVPKIKFNADLFISTWGISESSKTSLKDLDKRKWFKSKHLLLAVQKGKAKFPIANKILIDMKKKNTYFEKTIFSDTSYYIFK